MQSHNPTTYHNDRYNRIHDSIVERIAHTEYPDPRQSYIRSVAILSQQNAQQFKELCAARDYLS